MKNVAVSASARSGRERRNRDRPLLRKLTKRSYARGRGGIRGFFALAISEGAARLCQPASWLNLASLPQLRGARAPQPLDKPEHPDHEKRQEENSSARKERRCKTCGHDILPGGLIACSLDLCLTRGWVRGCRDVFRVIGIIRNGVAPSFVEPFADQDRGSASRYSLKNSRRSDRKTPCFRERRPWQQRRKSDHDWNRTRSENPTHQDGHPVECASTRLRL